MAQTEKLDRERWQELKDNIDYTQPIDNRKNKRKSGSGKGRKQEDKYDPIFNWNTNGGTLNISPVFQMVIIVIVIIALIALLVRILGHDLLFANKKIRDRDSVLNLDDMDEIPEESDLERWLRQAKESNDLVLVMRIYYIIIIKDLDLQGLIRWKKEKTNRDFQKELGDHSCLNDFKSATETYELVWFGEHDFDPKHLNAMVQGISIVSARIKEHK